MGRSQYELQHCIALHDWATRQSVTLPVLRLLIHIPNGGARPFVITKDGRRYSPEGQKLRRMGVQPGVWDYFMPVPRIVGDRQYAGLWIEMKDKDAELTEDQKWWGNQMAEQSYATVISRSWLAARECILEYLNVLESLPRLSKCPH